MFEGDSGGPRDLARNESFGRQFQNGRWGLWSDLDWRSAAAQQLLLIEIAGLLRHHRVRSGGDALQLKSAIAVTEGHSPLIGINLYQRLGNGFAADCVDHGSGEWVPFG